MRIKIYKRGVSILETIMAIGIMSVLILAATSIVRASSIYERRSRVITEVEYQASHLMHEITQSLRNATSISSPATGATATALNLAVTSISAQNPTVYTYVPVTQRVTVARAGAQAVQLSSDAVQVTALTFANVSAPSTEGAVRVTLTVRYANPTNDSVLAYTTTRSTTVTLR